MILEWIQDACGLEVGDRHRASDPFVAAANHVTEEKSEGIVKALIFERNGEPADVLAIRDLPDPVPGPGELLVRVRLSPVNPSDLHVIRGRFGRQPVLPASPGLECVGVVQTLGPGTQGPISGTRVVLVDVPGTWRELLVCPAERVVPVPDEEDAAQALVNPVTAWVLTMVEHRMQRGEWLTQTAGGSTVGRLILQLARSEGFRTINIVYRRPQVLEIAKLGGDVTLCTEDDDWPAQLVKALSSHRQTERSALEMPIFGPGLIYSAATVQGWFLFHWLATTPLPQCVSVLRNVLDRLASGALRLPPARRYSAAQIGDALRDAEASARDRKPILDFAEVPARA